MRKTVRLTEVFGAIYEDSRGNIVKLLKMPKDLADIFHKEDKKNSFVLAKWFKEWLVDNGQDVNNADLISVYTFMNGQDEGAGDTTEYGRTLSLSIKDNPGLAKQLSKLNYKDAFAKAKEKSKNLQKHLPVVMKFRDGMKWVNLQKSSCEYESDKMSHCGSDTGGGILYSLRDENEKPHVTLSYDEKHNVVTQLKGAGNSIPHKKYWNYIKEFFKDKKAKVGADDDLLKMGKELWDILVSVGGGSSVWKEIEYEKMPDNVLDDFSRLEDENPNINFHDYEFLKDSISNDEYYVALSSIAGDESFIWHKDGRGWEPWYYIE